jgi:hypothetical protein
MDDHFSAYFSIESYGDLGIPYFKRSPFVGLDGNQLHGLQDPPVIVSSDFPSEIAMFEDTFDATNIDFP